MGDFEKKCALDSNGSLGLTTRAGAPDDFDAGLPMLAVLIVLPSRPVRSGDCNIVAVSWALPDGPTPPGP